MSDAGVAGGVNFDGWQSFRRLRGPLKTLEVMSAALRVRTPAWIKNSSTNPHVCTFELHKVPSSEKPGWI